MKVIGKLFGGVEVGQNSGYLVFISEREWLQLASALNGNENSRELAIGDSLYAFGKFAAAVKYAHRILNEAPAPKAD